MATKKDLVEAYSFSRRRLITAFVSGAPGGREVEPARPGRTIVGGLALAVLLVAGAAIAGIFSPSLPEDWDDQPGLVVSEETGGAYVITADAVDDAAGQEGGTGPVLRPIINITSAMLILGPDLEPVIVPQAEIDGETIGEDLGILGAPAGVPSADLLIDRGWTACASSGGGVMVGVSANPGVAPQPGGGLVVRADRDFFLIAQAAPTADRPDSAYSYELPDDPAARDGMLEALGLPTSFDATRVPRDWLALFPAGGPLAVESFGLTNAGDRIEYGGGDSGLSSQARVGDYVDQETGAFLLTADGPAPLAPFQLAIYRNLAESPREVQAGELGVARARPTWLDARWPDLLLTPVLGEQCVQLQAAAGSPPAVSLAGDPNEAASADEVPSDQIGRAVDPGRGAHVLSGGWEDTDTGSPHLIDAKGLAYPLAGFMTADLLGYGAHDPPVVPDSWVELFDAGVGLSQEAALCPPTGGGCG